MRQKSIRPENTEFVILSFEGPDGYSLAGGLGVRVNHLSTTLAKMGFPTHLFFVGDPHLPAEQRRCRKKLVLHRWCQWISEYYPDGVYHGEEDKLRDFNQSIPAFVTERVVNPAVDSGKLVVVLGEEWHTAETMCRLSDALHSAGLRDRVVMLWNANNTFSFHRIDWGRLSYTTTITTVSRYMKHVMRRMGVNPLVIPNGIPKSLLERVDPKEVREIRQALNSDLLMCKVARWDPDKCWYEAVAATAKLKGKGFNPTLLARGGIEGHGSEVLSRARSLGLAVKEATTRRGLPHSYLEVLRESTPADVIDIRFHMPQEFLRLLYRASDCVLANSGHEPFGLVGLEAMAAGGIVFAGCTGEDYAIPFVNAFVLETADPEEIVGYIMYLREYPEEAARMRKAARRTARLFTWEAATQNLIGRVENQARMQRILRGKPVAEESTFVVPQLTDIAVAATRDIPADDWSMGDTVPQAGERELVAVA